MSNTTESAVNNPAILSDLPFKVRVLWGSPKDREPDDEPTEYEFHTEAERDAFLHGAEEGVGWMAHEVIEQNSDGTWPEPESVVEDVEENEEGE
jgi:hypothetical protein